MKSNPLRRIVQCCLMLLFMALNTSALFAQNITIKGNVSDPNGEAIIGASVMVEGTSNGTITDLDGNYTISCLPKASLVISYMGYAKQIIPVNGKTLVNVVLKEDSKVLDEVVVVGYGVQRKSDLTGAVSSVKAGEAIKQMPVANIADALQGRMSGVSVVNSSGAPDSDPQIRVRGVNSIQGEGGPLVVIDGFIGGSLASLNPTDISSIEVLKDASATAVYGSRGANGVILVTTRRPDKGAVKVDVSSYVNIQKPYAMLPMLDAYGYARLANEYAEDRGLGQFFSDQGEGNVMSQYANGTLRGFNYFDNIFRESAIQNVNEISISGGSDAVRFLFSGSYNYNEGTVRTSKAERFNYNLKIDADVNKWLKVGFNTRGDYVKSQGANMQEGGYNPLLINVLKMAPTILPRDPETGKYNNYSWPDKTNPMYNPMGQIEQVNTFGYTYNSYLQGFFDITFMKGLTFRMQQSFSFASQPSGATNNEDSYKASGISGTGTTAGQTTAEAKTVSRQGWLNTNILSYMSSFNENHRINATLVFEQSSAQKFENSSTGNYLLWKNNEAFHNVGIAEYVNASSDFEKTTLMSALGRVNYTMFNRYMLTFSYRLDGSSRLAYKNRWEGFMAGAVAWDIRNEKFFEPARNIFDQFKIRVGYGETGNQNVPAYSAHSKYKFTRSNTRLENGQWATSNSMVLDERGNPDLCWERTEQSNIGLDLSLFNSRLTFNFDAYYKNSKGVLMKVNLPSYTGFAYELRNAARLENRGYEFTIAGTPIATGKWNWNSNLVLSFGQTKVADLGVDSYGKTQDYVTVAGGYYNNFYRYLKGEPIGTIYGYVNEGVWTTQTLANFKERMLASGYSLDDYNKLGYVPGQYRYKHAEGREFEKLNEDDQTIIGRGQPKFNWGWTNSLNYKDFDFALYVIGYHGFDVYNYTAYSRDNLTPNPEMFNRWTSQNENSDRAGFVANRNAQSVSSRWIEKGDFIKVKSITLGYSLPKYALQKIGFNKFRVYGSIQNPFIITKYSGMDPEVTLNKFLTPGNDYGYYPNGRSFIVGLNVAF